MDTLRIRPVGLAELDVVRLGAFLRFVGTTDRRKWALVREGEAELLVCTRSSRADVVDVSGRAVMIVVDRGDTDPVGSRDLKISRPLDLDSFKAALCSVEAVSPALAAGSAGTHTGEDAALMDGSAISHPLYRLHKWPGVELLRSHPKFVRILGFLAHRAVDLKELQRLSGVDEGTCVGLLARLNGMGLLVCIPREEDPHTQTAPPAPAAQHGARERDQITLIGRLRMRLGLS